MMNSESLPDVSAYQLKIEPPAKLNLFLEVTGERSDGFHTLESIFQSVSVYDVLYLRRSDGPRTQLQTVYADYILPGSVPENIEGNIIGRAVREFQKETDIVGSYDILVEKNIPVGGGMGGGSADAAGIIRGLQELHNNPLSAAGELDIARRLGADVPFCLQPGTARVSGIGHDIEMLDPGLTAELHFIMIFPPVNCNTKKVYKNIKIPLTKELYNINILLTYLREKSYGDIIPFLFNRLFAAACVVYPQLRVIKKEVEQLTGRQVCLSGSGSTLFMVFLSADDMQNTCRVLRETTEYVIWPARSVSEQLLITRLS